jgi:Xaa-Pro aminopeptidase
MPQKIALLSPRQVIPAALVDNCAELVGAENIVDAQELYWKIKYEKSPAELAMVRAASAVADAVMETLLTVIRPGLLETQVAAWGYFVARELGAEEMGFDIMVGGGDANRTIIGKALNRVLKENDYVHLGVGTKCDGLNACVRRSIILTNDAGTMTDNQRFYFDFVQKAYQRGFDAYCNVAENNLPAKLQEQSLVDFFAGHADEFSTRLGKKIDLVNLKPYTGTHNSGYTECQEFYGAITLESENPLGENIVTMLDVALRGIGDNWYDVKIPDLDYLVIEDTLIKTGKNVERVTKLPIDVQYLVKY